MTHFERDCNFDIKNFDYRKELETILYKNGVTNIVTKKVDDNSNNYCMSSEIKTRFLKKEHDVVIHISAIFDENVLKKISLDLFQDVEDTENYELELCLFYYKKIQDLFLEGINKKEKKFTIRNYRKYYGSKPIKGAYTIKYNDLKVCFKTLCAKEREEPLTEHIMAFDIEVLARDIMEARAKAHNYVSDITSYLSVLLDLGFYDMRSQYVSFVLPPDFLYRFSNMQPITVNKKMTVERYRTGFVDDELKLVIKDNFNGLIPVKHAIQGNGFSGIFAISTNESITQQSVLPEIQKEVNDIFENHRIYKVNNNQKEENDYGDTIEEKQHYLNREIRVPRSIRIYFKELSNLRKDKYDTSVLFRNACRIYNLSKQVAINNATQEITYLVDVVETLGKIEAIGFSEFMCKYCDENLKNRYDLIYSIRSKFVHAGEFSFFEYEESLNPYSDPKFIVAMKYHDDFVGYIRKAIIIWIKKNILNE